MANQISVGDSEGHVGIIGLAGYNCQCMRKWAIVLHFYQPPTQDPLITKTVLYSCYLPLLKMLERHEGAKVTLNLTGSLLFQLGKLGAGEFFLSVRRLIDLGRVSLINCPVHHPVIPLTPPGVVLRQLDRNRQVLRETLGVEPLSRGIFLPELAVDEQSLDRLADRPEYEFAVVDEEAVSGEYRPVARWKKLKLAVNKRAVSEVLRSYPGKMRADKLLAWVESQVDRGGTIVSANDAELFGHHYEERGEVLEGLLSSANFEFVSLAEVMEQDTDSIQTDRIVASTWQAKTMGVGAFDLWADKQNGLQQGYLKLANMAAQSFESWADKLSGHELRSANEHLDQGWSSCHLYWLSNRPWWHPEVAGRGAENLIKCIRSLPMAAAIKAEAEKSYHDLVQAMWLYHWSDRVEEKYREYEASRAQWLTGLPKL